MWPFGNPLAKVGKIYTQAHNNGKTLTGIHVSAFLCYSEFKQIATAKTTEYWVGKKTMTSNELQMYQQDIQKAIWDRTNGRQKIINETEPISLSPSESGNNSNRNNHDGESTILDSDYEEENRSKSTKVNQEYMTPDISDIKKKTNVWKS